MTNSRRKTPIFGMTTATSEKQFKAREHRRQRRAVRAAVRTDAPIDPPAKFGPPWAGPKDGKRYWKDVPTKGMRK